MADLDYDLDQLLRNERTITPFIGVGSAARCFPDVPRQGTPLPFVVREEIGGGEQVEHLTGVTDLCQTGMSLWSYGATRKQANELGEAVRERLQRKREIWGSTRIVETGVIGNRDCGVDLPQDGSDTKRYWTRYQFYIWHRK